MAAVAASVLCCGAGCLTYKPGDLTGPVDAGHQDGGTPDAGIDGGTPDAGPPDGGTQRACALRGEAPAEPSFVVSVGGELVEYELRAVLVESCRLKIPRPVDEAQEVPRDLVQGPDGRVYVYNGTLEPRLSILDPITGVWTHHALAGWSTRADDPRFGGIALAGDHVYATDMVTPGAGAPSGLARFDLDGGNATHVSVPVGGPIDVSVGPGDELYVLASDGRTVTVKDPRSGDVVGAISLDRAVSAIAVRDDGTILGAGVNNLIYLFDLDGKSMKSMASGTSSLMDIDIGRDGRVLVSSEEGKVVVTNVNLEGQATTFTVATDPVFLAFVHARR